jgi:hypothetical protein
MTSALGETMEAGTSARYYKHPSGSSSWLQDGKPLDSGTAHILDNNLSHLGAESVRCWVADYDPFDIADDGGYGNIVGETNPDAGPEAEQEETPAEVIWERTTSAVYGPFPAIADHEVNDRGGLTVRKVRVKFLVYASAANSMRVMCALTRSEQTPLEDQIAFGYDLVNATGETTRTIDLVATVPLDPRPGPRSRVGNVADQEVISQEIPVWLWVSARQIAAGTLGVIAVSAYEIRE